MFERYTEKARRVIFFARYEASQFGAHAIEAEHILLGLLREDKQLVQRFFQSPNKAVRSIRKEIEDRSSLRDKVSVSVDLPLSTSARRVLSSAADESDRLSHRHIGTEHLLLGILLEETSLAARILYDRGLRLSQVREYTDTLQETEHEASNADAVYATQHFAEVDEVVLHAQFWRLLDLLVRKGVINEDERRQIASE